MKLEAIGKNNHHEHSMFTLNNLSLYLDGDSKNEAYV